MPLIVGNLLTDPESQSFISIDDANAYLQVEQNTDWQLADVTVKEAALVNASRWLAVSLSWCSERLSPAELVRVGQVAARLASQSLTVDLWASEEIGKMAKRYKADTVEIEYQDASSVRGAIAGGRRFPFVYDMLRGLLCGGGAQHWIVRT